VSAVGSEAEGGESRPLLRVRGGGLQWPSLPATRRRQALLSGNRTPGLHV